MTPRSERNLAGLHPLFAARIRAAADRLKPIMYLLVVEGIRTAAEQNADWRKGRDSNGVIVRKRDVVTNARAGESMHQYGLAADIVPYLRGNTGELNWNPDTQQFRQMVATLKKQDLVWGGDWATLKDNDHFQMPGLPVSPTADMRMLYGYGNEANLPNIWHSLEAMIGPVLV